MIKNALFSVAAVSVTDAQGNIVDVSPAFEALSGYSRAELIGKTHRIFNSGTHDAAFWKEFWQTISQGRPFLGEICERHKQGHLYWSKMGASPILDDQGSITGYIGIHHDITALKALAHEMDDALLQMRQAQQTQARLRHADQLAALANMGTGIAHEVNQPLTFISAVIQSLQRAIKRNVFDGDSSLHMLTESRRQVERITLVLQNLRAMAEKNDGLAHAVSWPDAVDGALLVMEQRLIAAGIFLQKDIAPDLPKVRGNLGAFEQLLLALLQNAFDAMQAAPRRALSLAMRQEGGQVILTLQDSGEGMEKKALEQAFNPYFTTRDPALHAGLGLTMALSTAVHYGGVIHLDSQPGEGTRVTLQFPALSAEDATHMSLLRGTLPRILWHDGLSVSNDLIDNEHRELFALANDMMDTIEARDPGGTHEFVLAALDALHQYTITHFADEENIWQTSGLPEIAVRSHLREHAELLAQLARLRQDCEADLPGADEAFVDFFREWVVGHVLIVDLRMGRGIQRLAQEAENAGRAG